MKNQDKMEISQYQADAHKSPLVLNSTYYFKILIYEQKNKWSKITNLHLNFDQ